MGLSIDLWGIPKTILSMYYMNYLFLFFVFCLTNSHELI